MDMSDTENQRKYYINVCRPINPVPGCDRHASVCQMKYITEQVCVCVCDLQGECFLLQSSFCFLDSEHFPFPVFPQGVVKETVSVSNMGVSKRAPVIEAHNRLLLEFTDGSICTSEGVKLTYTTRIHLVCSRGTVVRGPDVG